VCSLGYTLSGVYEKDFAPDVMYMNGSTGSASGGELPCLGE